MMVTYLHFKEKLYLNKEPTLNTAHHLKSLTWLDLSWIVLAKLPRISALENSSSMVHGHCLHGI